MDIQEDHVGRLALDQIERFASIGGTPSGVPVLGERARHEVANDRIVVDDEHSTARSHVRGHTECAHACKKRTRVGRATDS